MGGGEGSYGGKHLPSSDNALSSFTQHQDAENEEEAARWKMQRQQKGEPGV